MARPREADWGEVGLLESDGLGVMVGGDGVDFAPTEGWRSNGSTPVARDPDVELTERSDASDFRGSSGSWSRGGDGGWSSIGGSNWDEMLGGMSIVGSGICGIGGNWVPSASATVAVLLFRVCFLPVTRDIRRTPLMKPRWPSFSLPLARLSGVASSILDWDVEREIDRAPYEAWRGVRGCGAVGTCIDFGRRGWRGEDGGEAPGVAGNPESCERSPKIAPRSLPLLVGASRMAKALRCLKLRSCLSSRVVDANGEAGVESGVSEDRKNQLGVWDGVWG